MARYAPNYGRRNAAIRGWIYLAAAVVVIAVSYLAYHRLRSGSAAPPAAKTPVNAPAAKLTQKPPAAVAFNPPAPKTTLQPPQTTPSETAADSRVAMLIDEAVKDLNSTPARIIDARDKLNEAMPFPMSEAQRNFVRAKLSELSDKWLFSKSIFPQDKLCTSYTVQQGDLLTAIGKTFKVPYEILMEINGIPRPEASPGRRYH